MPEKNVKPREDCVAIHWFRHGLRLHDNPAMLESIRSAKTLYPIFIFDGKVAGTFNRYLDESAVRENTFYRV